MIDLDALLPHRPPFRFVERILFRDPRGGACLGRFPSSAVVADRGLVPVLLGLELAAQAVALLAATSPAGDGPAPHQAPRPAPGRGYLVSLRDVRCHRAWLPAEVALHAAVRALGASGPLGLHQVRVGPHVSDPPGTLSEVWLEGTIGTYLALG